MNLSLRTRRGAGGGAVGGGLKSGLQRTATKTVQENVVTFPYGDRTRDRYVGIKRIGAGTFADIWEVYDQYDPERKHWALKVLKSGKYRKAGSGSVDADKLAKYENAMASEGNRIRKLNKQDWAKRAPIVRCKELLNTLQPNQMMAGMGRGSTSSPTTGPCLVLELMGISLLQYIQICERKQVVVSLRTVRSIAVQLFAAMSFLHGKGGYVHADLKPENVLISLEDSIDANLWSNEHPKIKVVDLGNALSYHRNINTFEVQSLYYRAPEVLFGNEISAAIDMWSIGCILVELININEFNQHQFWPKKKKKTQKDGAAHPATASQSSSSSSNRNGSNTRNQAGKSNQSQTESKRRSAAQSGSASTSRSSRGHSHSRRRPTRRAHHALLACRSTTELAQKMHSVLSPFPEFVYNSFYSFHYEQMAAMFRPMTMTHCTTSYTTLKETRKLKLMERLSIEEDAAEYEQFIDLISGLLDLDPATRYSSEDGIQHRFCIAEEYLEPELIELLSSTFDSAYPAISISSDQDRQFKINQEVNQYSLLKAVSRRDPSSSPVPQKRALTQRESAFVSAFPAMNLEYGRTHNAAICAIKGCCQHLPYPFEVEVEFAHHEEGSETPPEPPVKKMKYNTTCSPPAEHHH